MEKSFSHFADVVRFHLFVCARSSCSSSPAGGHHLELLVLNDLQLHAWIPFHFSFRCWVRFFVLR
jgi:hypothetical protein